MYKINHIHLKSKDPEADANWFQKAFNFKITSDEVRAVGDRFISCESEGGLRVNISGERSNEKLGPSDADPHYGLEHFGFDSSDINKFSACSPVNPCVCVNKPTNFEVSSKLVAVTIEISLTLVDSLADS